MEGRCIKTNGIKNISFRIAKMTTIQQQPDHKRYLIRGGRQTGQVVWIFEWMVGGLVDLNDVNLLRGSKRLNVRELLLWEFSHEAASIQNGILAIEISEILIDLIMMLMWGNLPN